MLIRSTGRFLVERMLEKAEGMEAKGIKLDSQVCAIDFYRLFGFREKGKIFKDAGIDHVEMVRVPIHD
ncbi:MAG: GNAT family N-acetyltransferase [Methanolobus sp.]|nr:GNAT family N-acetyltransferase [Methanolobus sp.]